MNKSMRFLSILLIAFGLGMTACTVTPAAINSSGSEMKTAVVITSPAAPFREGDDITVQSVSSDPAGIVRVELLVDGNIVRTDSLPTPQVPLTIIQTWKATVGTHVITIRGTNTRGAINDLATVSLTIASRTNPTATATRAPVGCVNNSAFVADVTVPDGSVIAPGQTFNKIWRVRNTGTCTWGPGDELVFIGGELMTSVNTLATPATAPGATADLLVAMTAPTAPGNYLGNWRMKSKAGTFFGTPVKVLINVPGQAVPNCPFTPLIESFTVSPSTIKPGESATLSWGFVKGAEIAEIDNDIGGVATPGSVTVSPSTTTTYTITGTCGSKVNKAQVTLNVVAPSPPPPPPSPTVTNTPKP
ncbi:MAG: hypothetical protein HY327_03205 [Chloroflexi bacterium]|nr:hypothetical protein [Chloroflexota bacterium]